jgi:hypothetical protein
MRRLILLIFLVSILVVSVSRTALPCGEPCRGVVSANPPAGVAPLSVVVTGRAPWAPAIDINMGGETSVVREYQWDPYDPYICSGFSAQHQFDCPGTYTISVYEHGSPDLSTTVNVTVLPPPTPIVYIFSGDSDKEAYLATYWYVAERPFEYSKVEWGDGTSETFAFTQRGGYFGTPNHAYAADGQYTATMTLHYSTQYCSWDQKVSAVVTIPNPTTPTRQQTWGSVKAMYR